MASGGFVKIYGDRLLRSSLWIKEDAVTRVLWVTMLGLADARGFVSGPLIALVDAAKLSRVETEHGIERLAAPDADSRNPRAGGRRIRATKGGWQIINYTAYRDIRTPGQVREAERKQRWRKSKADNVPQGDMSRMSHTEVEVEVEREVETTNTPAAPVVSEKPKRSRPALPPFDALFEEAWGVYPKRPGNSKAGAWRQWLVRVGEGVDPPCMLEGARRYAAHCERERIEPRYVKQAETFFGRDRHFATDWGPVAGPDPKPEEVYAKVFGVPAERILALWAEEDQGLAIAARKRGAA